MNPLQPLIPPAIRQWLYTIAALGTAIIPILVAYHVLDDTAAGAWLNVVAILGSLGSVGATTAAVVTAKQRKEGTLDFTGSPAQQAVSAIQATVNRAGVAQHELQEIIQAVSTALSPPAPPAPRPAPVISWVAPEAPLPSVPPLVADLIRAVNR